MNKRTLKFLEIILIVIIILVCSISLLQNETIFGYHSYIITSDNTNMLENNNLILVKEIDINKIEKNDIIAYKNNSEEVITSEVESIITTNNEMIIKTKETLVYEEQIYGKYQYKFIFLGVISKIIGNKIGFAVCVLIPFISLIILELLNIYKVNKTKEKNFKEVEILSDIENKELIEKTKGFEEIVETKIKEQKQANKKYEQTIQIPLLEIQKQLNESTTKEKNTSLEDTLVLFNNEDIKKAIKKELSTKTVDKNKKENNKSTESVEKPKIKNNKSTTSVDKEENKKRKSTKTVESKN